MTWVLIQPLFLVGTFTFFFSNTLNISTDNIPPALFYFSGLVYWNLFSSGLNNAGNSLVLNAPMLKKIYFPRLIIPISSILVVIFDFLVAWLVFALLVLYFQFSVESFNINFFLFLFVSFFALITTIGTTFALGVLIAALNVQYRDFKHVLPFLIQSLLFLTPVIYPISVLEKYTFAKYLLSLNPMTAVIHISRSIF
ncbi:MAG: ABC transporter permease, partial [Bacteroidota bacterium]